MEGTKRQVKEYTQEIGVFEGKVIGINPDKEELENILQTEIEKEPVYITQKTADKANGIRISVWLKDVNSEEDKVYNCSFFLQNEARLNKEKTKVQFINSVGQTSWGLADENGSDLPQWFTHFVDNRTGAVGEAKVVRKALVGEEELMGFIKSWLKFDLYDHNTDILLNTDKLFKDNVKELTEQIGGEYDQTVIAMATVRSVTKESESGEPITVNYQSVYNKAFASGFAFKFLKGVEFTEDKIKKIREKPNKKLENFERFILAITDSQYGCKDSYFIGVKKPFDANAHVVATDKVLDSSGADY